MFQDGNSTDWTVIHAPIDTVIKFNILAWLTSNTWILHMHILYISEYSFQKRYRLQAEQLLLQYFVAFIASVPFILLKFAVVFRYRGSVLPHLKIRGDMINKF